ncbi:MAG: hypothetical protein OHK006_23750 [Thermodesulfovibrionales bacterium]
MCMLCPPWLSFILYNPVRKAFTDRGKILDESGITPDSVVLEVGAGNGFLTEAIARRARRNLAVELQKGMVEKLARRVGGFGSRVEIITGDIASIPFEPGIADVCLLYYSFHEISRQAPAASNISRAVKQGGILAIYEPSVEVSRSAMERAVHIFEQEGFLLQHSRSGLFTRFARMTKQQ